MKKNIWKRLATLTIMAALVLCLLPLGVSADYVPREGDTNPRDIGSTFTSDSGGDYCVQYEVSLGPTSGSEDKGEVVVCGYTGDPGIDGAVTIPDKIKYKDGSTEYQFTVTGIEEDAFENCAALKSISYPAGITVGDGAFKGTSAKCATHRFDKTAADGVCKVCDYNCEHGDLEQVTHSDGMHNGFCSLCGRSVSGFCTPGEDGNCIGCDHLIKASVVIPNKILYFTDADAALEYADVYPAYTVTILKNATVNRGTVKANLVVNSGFTLTVDGEDNGNWGLTVHGQISGGGTITSDNEPLAMNGCTGGTFNLPVTNFGLVTGGIFRQGLTNYGEVRGGTICGALHNVNGYDPIHDHTAVGSVNANKLSLGDGFQYSADEGTTLICSHEHSTPATCVDPQKCPFQCAGLDPIDPDAHSPIYAATGSEINETCANGCTHSATATLDISTDSVTYNGAAQTIATVTHSETWLGERLTAQYENNTNVGTATVYIQAGEAKAVKTFAITKATPTLEHFDITLPQNAVYDGTEKAATIDPKAGVKGMGEVSIKYYQGETELNNTPTNAGTYTVEFTVTEGSNYLPAKLLAGSFTIAKAETVKTAPVAKENLVYDGTAQELSTAGVVSDAAKAANYKMLFINPDDGYSEEILTGTDAGTYTVNWHAGYDNDNFNMSRGEFTVTIAPATITVTPDAQTITYGDAAPALTYTSSGHVGAEIPVFEGELAVDSWEGGTREIKQGTLKIVDGSSFNASNYVLKFVPGTLTVEQAANSWIAAPNVTDWDYGMTPNIPTADPRFGTLIREFRLESGTDADYKTEIPTAPGTYLVRFRVEETGSWTGLSQVEKLNIGRAALRVQVKDQTIKLGQQIDKTAYTVVGLAAGDTATVTLTASTDKVTVDGRIEAKVAVRNAKGEDVTDYYTLALMDSKLTIKPDTSGIDALTAENVTSADKQAINAVLDALKNAESTDKAWDDIADKCENLLTEIEAAQAAANSQNVEKVENVNSGNVKPENKADLEKAKAELEKALQDHGDNFTEAEKQVIKDKIQRMNGAVESLEKAEDITEAVAQLPKTVEPDDEATAEKILAAKAAYDGLTDHEKSLVDQTAKGKLDELVTALTAYDIVKGDGSQWIEGVDGSLSFTANGPFSKFVGIEVDGKAVDAKYYDAKSGSTIISLKESYLKQLSAGKHTITVHYSDGKTSGVFTIQLDPTVPATGDESNIMLYGAVLAVSLAGLAALVLAAKNRRKKNA